VTFLDLVHLRRSVRRYRPEAVPREALERCLEAARLAPSACNSQPWRFLVVETPELRKRIVTEALSGPYAMNAFAASAPVLVVAVTEGSRWAARMAGLFRGVPYALMDLGMACEHLALQAAEDGLGTCMLGWFAEKAVKRLLGLSPLERVDLLLTLGYPDDHDTPGTPKPKARKSLETVRRYL